MLISTDITLHNAKLRGARSHSYANGLYRTPYIIIGIGAPHVPVITLKYMVYHYTTCILTL